MADTPPSLLVNAYLSFSEEEYIFWYLCINPFLFEYERDFKILLQFKSTLFDLVSPNSGNLSTEILSKSDGD